MNNTHKISTALISVSDKTGIVDLAKKLAQLGIKILSTGGTAKLLQRNEVPVIDVGTYTGFPEILDGRVKTLHPKVHGGILACLDQPEHNAALEQHGISPIGLVIVNLYPFAETAAKGGEFQECIEEIDVGGPCMIRAAAKNHRFTTIITDCGDYQPLIAQLEAHNCATSLQFRQKMAAKAFAKTAYYDAIISNWFMDQEEAVSGQELPETITIPGLRISQLRYGENPHQASAFYKMPLAKDGLATAKVHQGKALSYNNLADASSAYELVCEFNAPTVAIIKHANPCGIAQRADVHTAYLAALACDPKSAFGGIVAFNYPIDSQTAAKLCEHFFEVIIAPEISKDALQLLEAKPSMRVLTLPLFKHTPGLYNFSTMRGGFLMQSSDHLSGYTTDITCVSEQKPDAKLLDELKFAFTLCKYVRSNAIIISANYQGLGIGAGQMSRVDSVEIACRKFNERKGELALTDIVPILASDAFFPFADGIELAAKNGIKAIIQPSGSIRDKDVIERANALGLILMHAGSRHFKH